ncbi:hypothetical protein QFZ24_005698 [Streptomyces phaeochromogenes]|jgi:hypothetical protein|uniref:hypothetical protein n=1 Tax=Streptomyces phaeochromogenes TaxID=1923 RepID=UPI0027927909|nr:hypothetical protein [Streptomyces phaeochromogenes]MDQ0951775.1 hypothetical protein [Streptomyces phaeochromogenes]
MSVGSGAGESRGQSSGRSTAGNIAFGAGLLLVLATMTLGAFAGVALTIGLADDSFLSSAVPDDGRNAVGIGGIGMGGLLGLMLPLLLLAAVRGTDEKPRLGPGEALLKGLAIVVFSVYLVVVSLLAAQLGWILPKGPTTLVSVFVVGFSWMPLAFVPWERFGLGGVGGLLPSSGGTSAETPAGTSPGTSLGTSLDKDGESDKSD